MEVPLFLLSLLRLSAWSSPRRGSARLGYVGRGGRAWCVVATRGERDGGGGGRESERERHREREHARHHAERDRDRDVDPPLAQHLQADEDEDCREPEAQEVELLHDVG